MRFFPREIGQVEADCRKQREGSLGADLVKLSSEVRVARYSPRERFSRKKGGTTEHFRPFG